MEAAKIVSDAIAALPATPTVDDIGTISLRGRSL